MQVVILDRDGVINEDSAAFVKNCSEWRPIAGSIKAIARLSGAGYRVYIATNQSGIARHLFTEQDLEAIHARCCEQVHAAGGKIAGIHYCPHGPDDRCSCRKPRPGLIQQIIHHSGVPATGIVIVGDSWRDLEAGRAAGCKQLILVRTGKGEATLATLSEAGNFTMPQIKVCANLAEATNLIQEHT